VLFGQERPTTSQLLRSQYERQMRAMGAQEERNRLARDLHDSIKQQLFAIQTAAATAEARFTSDPTGSRTAMAQVRDIGRDAMGEMEALVDQLRATPTENAGLVAAIRHQCEATRLRTGAIVTCEIGALPSNESLPPGVHLALFRVCQEALSNAARHSRASHVRVALERRGARLELTVEDDGLGFDVAADSNGMGLRNIRQRIDEFSGDTHVRSDRGTGTTIFVSVPFADGDPKHYMKQAAWRAAALAAGIALSLVPLPSGRRGPSPLVFFWMILAVDLTRYLVAWRRSARLQSAA
jgi:signal transduction histidine kinase